MFQIYFSNLQQIQRGNDTTWGSAIQMMAKDDVITKRRAYWRAVKLATWASVEDTEIWYLRSTGSNVAGITI